MQENSTGKALGWEPSEVVDIRAQHRFERRSTFGHQREDTVDKATNRSGWRSWISLCASHGTD